MNAQQVILNPSAMPPLYTLLSLVKINQAQYRAKFKILYEEHIQAGPLFYDEKDIIKKDVKRLPAELFSHLDAVYPPLSKASFQSLVDDILRVITRFSLGTAEKIGSRVEYIEGMHELVGVSLYIALEEAVGPTSPQASARTEECAADAWAFATYLIEQLLDVYIDNTALLRFCGYVRQFIKELSPELYQLAERENIPPYETFTQKSIFLFFARDFSLNRISFIWVFLISAIQIYQQQFNGPFELFPAFVLAQIFIWRHSNMQELGLESVHQIFLEQNELFTSRNEKPFLQACWANFQQMVIGAKNGIFPKQIFTEQKPQTDNQENGFDHEKLVDLHRKNLSIFNIVNEAIAETQQCVALDDVIICVYDKLQQARFAAQQLLELGPLVEVEAPIPCQIKEILMDQFKIQRNWALLRPE